MPCLISSFSSIGISSDDGFNYTMVYKADSDGKGILIDELYHQGNYSSYPIYTLQSAIDKLNTLDIQVSGKLLIHGSQYK